MIEGVKSLASGANWTRKLSVNRRVLNHFATTEKRLHCVKFKVLKNIQPAYRDKKLLPATNYCQNPIQIKNIKNLNESSSVALEGLVGDVFDDALPTHDERRRRNVVAERRRLEAGHQVDQIVPEHVRFEDFEIRLLTWVIAKHTYDLSIHDLKMSLPVLGQKRTDQLEKQMVVQPLIFIHN